MPKGYKKDLSAPVPPAGTAASAEAQVVPFMFTGFQPLSGINGKNVASSYAKSEHQSWWTRRADDVTWEGQRHWKKTVMLGGDDSALLATSDSLPAGQIAPAKADAGPKQGHSPHAVEVDASQTYPPASTANQPAIVDPAQRTIVIHPGASSVRIGRASDPAPISIPNVVARRRVATSGNTPPAGVFRRSEPNFTPEALDTFTSKVSAIRAELRSRMRQLKLRGITNGLGIAANSNADASPLVLSDGNDPLGTTWPIVSGPQAKDVYVGDDALLVAEPEKNGYAVRWPLKGGHLNTSEDSGYDSKNEILADIETVWLYALSSRLGVREQELKEYSAILILPDIYDHVYLREMVDLLFRGLGFKQICFQQESLCACFGAGLGTACVVDIGASKTSISCVEEGWIIPDTRLQLAIGGDDITTVLCGMLRKQNFPYKDLNLNCTWEWQMMERLKEDMLVLSEGDVGLNSYTFFVRQPGKPTTKWTVKAYDEVIIPAMILFSPSIVDFDRKSKSGRPLYADKDGVDDVLDLGGDVITEAMRSVTGIPAFSKPLPPALAALSQNGLSTESTRANPASVDEPLIPATEDWPSPRNGTPQPTGVNLDSNAPTRRSSPSLPGSKPHSTVLAAPIPVESVPTPPAAFAAALNKVPLHEAVLHSILACGTEEKCRRMAGAIMIVGGGGLIHNVGYAITARVQPMLGSRFPNIENVSAIPPPRDIDPKILAWKGISLICKLEFSNDLWIRSSDWEVLGSKAIKDRTMFI